MAKEEVPGAPFTPEEINKQAEAMPIRQELTVIPADPPGKPLGWTVREYNGAEIKLRHDGPDGTIHLDPIRTKEGLKPGMTVYVPALTGGYHVMTVKADSYGVLHASDDVLMAVLRFGEDDRASWVVVGLVNIRAIVRLGILDKLEVT